MQRGDLVEPELSYRIVGVCFEVHNALGSGHPERVYQRAVAEALRAAGISFREQVPVSVVFRERSVGRHFLDFLVEDRIVVELKRDLRIRREYIQQVVAYLRARKLQLGIVANFGPRHLTFRRILNLPNHDSYHS